MAAQEIFAKTRLFSMNRFWLLVPWLCPVTEAFTPRMVTTCLEQSSLGSSARTEKLANKQPWPSHYSTRVMLFQTALCVLVSAYPYSASH
jgi:hypothetical protein